jgi:HD-GYP domain-containing protein (c-di-GMP phosphodiesterase class II)
LRLAELVSAFSLVCDLVMGQPADEVMRACLLATSLARRAGLDEPAVSDVYWTTLLAHTGCTAYAHEQAAMFGGDEIAVNAAGSKTDFGEPREILGFLGELTRGRRAAERVRLVANMVVGGKRFDAALSVANCEIAATVADRLGLSPAVAGGLLDMFERWDGQGSPHGRRGDEIALPARFAQLAHQAAVFLRIGGADAALGMVRRRAGKALDPTIAAAFAADGMALSDGLAERDPCEAVLAAEPAPWLRVPATRLVHVASVFAEVVDLKTPLLMGHSAGVADLAARAAAELGMSEAEVEQMRIAGLLHDLGRVAVPNGVWEKAGALTQAEWEQVRLHAYHSERVLMRAPALAPIAPLAGMHHERLDGSGYHRQLGGPALPLPARVLAAADTFRAVTEPRRHRDALDADAAADCLRAEVRAGRLDGGAVDAVVGAAGARRRAGRPRQPGDLTEREREVLCLIARGHSNRDVARRLSIAPRTVGRHVEHIYGKLGIKSRAAAALFAATNGLVE